MDSDFHIYIKFDGPEANQGRVNIEKAGKTLVAFSRIFRKYVRDCKKETGMEGVLKIDAILTGSTELQIIADVIKGGIETGGYLYGGKLVFDNFGIKDFFQGFMKTTGEQLSLKIFSKNKPVQEGKIEGTKIYLINQNNEQKAFEYETWKHYSLLAPYLNDLYNLESGKEDTMKLGYKEGGVNTEVGVVTTNDREYFMSWENSILSDRLSEDFDDAHTVEKRITGLFVDYYGLAHKYHFSFQARRHQNEIGKQKILCIVDNETISQAIDYLKPENKHNITIGGRAVLDRDGKVDKIKIEWISNNSDYNPNQTTIN